MPTRFQTTATHLLIVQDNGACSIISKADIQHVKIYPESFNESSWYVTFHTRSTKPIDLEVASHDDANCVVAWWLGKPLPPYELFKLNSDAFQLAWDAYVKQRAALDGPTLEQQLTVE